MRPAQFSPQFRLWQLCLGFSNTAVLHALVKIGVIEQLRDRPRRLPELAQTCGSNAGVLYRALRFAVVIEIMTQDGDQYALTEMGRLLLKDVPGSLYMGLLVVGSEPWQRAWQNFTHALVTGDNAFTPAMGNGFFEYLDQHPEYGAPYNHWMTISTTTAARAIVTAYDFSPFTTVCDVGGGQGILLKSILAANRHLRGILYDQESVVKDHVLGDMSERVEIQAGNFFDRVPATDVLLLKSVLHDWNDEKCQVILGACRKVMQAPSRLLIIEMVIAAPTDLMGAFYDLHMQVLLGGRERTANEFSLLLQQAGLKLNRIIPTESPVKIIEACL
ncbi:MAG: methyltransferase [Candidatus Binatia bacterium]